MLTKLVRRYRTLFNNLLEIAYKSLDKWLQILVNLKNKLMYKTPFLFYNSLRDYIKIDKVFDAN